MISHCLQWFAVCQACFCGWSLLCPPGQLAFLTGIWGHGNEICLHRCPGHAGQCWEGRPKHQPHFASRRRKDHVLLRAPSACFWSAGLSLRPTFTAFSCRHLSGISLSCPEPLLWDYSHEAVSGAVSPACWCTDEDIQSLLACDQPQASLSSLSVPGKIRST